MSTPDTLTLARWIMRRADDDARAIFDEASMVWTWSTAEELADYLDDTGRGVLRKIRARYAHHH